MKCCDYGKCPNIKTRRNIIAGVVTAKHGEYGFLFCCSVPFSLLWPCEKLWPLILELLVEAAVNSVSMIS